MKERLLRFRKSWYVNSLCFTRMCQTRRAMIVSALWTEQLHFSSKSNHCETTKGGIWRGFRGAQNSCFPGNIYLIYWEFIYSIVLVGLKKRNTCFASISLPWYVFVCVRVCVFMCEMRDLTGSCKYSTCWRTFKPLNYHSFCHILRLLCC